MLSILLRVRTLRSIIHFLVGLSGAATLSWEVIWQIKSSLALGASAQGTAITLAVTMGGLGLGAALMGRALRKISHQAPLHAYGLLECVIGLAGLFLGVAFHAIEKMDTFVYASSPEWATLAHILGIIAVLGLPTICMGATLPVFGLIARQFQTPLSYLYGLNTLGAACGTLLAAFALIPLLGISRTGWIIAILNFSVGIAAILLDKIPHAEINSPDVNKPKSPSHFYQLVILASQFSTRILRLGSLSTEEVSGTKTFEPLTEKMVVMATGFAVLSLEVAWFRSISSAFQTTTYAFAIILASVLIALGYSASQVKAIKQRGISLGSVLAWAGILILAVTPLVERFDLFINWNNHGPDSTVENISPALYQAHTALYYNVVSSFNLLNLFFLCYIVIGLPMFLLGVGFPWILENQTEPRRWGKLYAFNTFASIAGSISAAWIFLPTLGFARTAWISGILIFITGLMITPGRKRRVAWVLCFMVSLSLAVFYDSGVGRTRAIGSSYFSNNGQPQKLVEFHEGPNSTVSVSEGEDGWRVLMIDGSSASAQSGSKAYSGVHYLTWMGSLPMLLHPHPDNVLIICFGTGQTANAVRHENPQSIDIVDINASVLRMAHNFKTNENVLDDPRVKTIVMDGRAYMRRTQKMYDVITLEPMPPNLAGVNALYSREFYESARQKLRPGGTIAQWLPINTIEPHYAASIARTFRDVFPNAILWNDPIEPVGILVGSTDATPDIGSSWPGFKRTQTPRTLSEDAVKQAVELNREQLTQYSAFGETITDDNQLLAYGKNAQTLYAGRQLRDVNVDFLKKFAR